MLRYLIMHIIISWYGVSMQRLIITHQLSQLPLLFFCQKGLSIRFLLFLWAIFSQFHSLLQLIRSERPLSKSTINGHANNSGPNQSQASNLLKMARECVVEFASLV